MKRVNLLSLLCLVAISLLAGCSDSTAPATGGAMMRDGAMEGDAMMKDDMKSDGMMQGDGMMKDDMKGDGMMKEESK
jgi:pentapeptide MXKDX repeat protein